MEGETSYFGDIFLGPDNMAAVGNASSRMLAFSSVVRLRRPAAH